MHEPLTDQRDSFLGLLWDARRARKHGPAARAQRQRARLAELVAYARAHSPYYRELYKDLPARVEDPALLPVTDKKQLMTRFDAWATDREVTLEKVRAFIGNPDLIGERFLGKYLVATTSGTTGTPGIFVLDERHLAVGVALTAYTLTKWLTIGDVIRVLGGGLRRAALHATGGHFVSVATVTRRRRSHRLLARQLKDFSVHTPLPALVAQLNEFRPAVLFGYATVVSLLAREQAAGRLQIQPVLVVVTAEGLALGEYDRIARAFGSKVGNVYGSTEVGYAAYSCAEGWLHVWNEWVVLEPVDADYRPTPPGEPSHTVLVSNLANRVQPILRYDLGDSVLQRPAPCPCGDPLPASRVQGRAGDVFTFPTERGEQVVLPEELAFAVADIPGLERSQVVQTTPTSLRVRLRLTAGADPDRVWRAAHTELTRRLAEHRLAHVTVERAEEPPEQSAGGKYRTAIPLRCGSAQAR
jgi:phenylacetate-CoA ligase